MANKTALITGVTGQDGSYLAELLLDKGYDVHGLVRRSSSINTSRIEHLPQDSDHSNPTLHLHYGDVGDQNRLRRIVDSVQPDEIYNLAAESRLLASFDMPIETMNVCMLGPMRILETVREFQQLTGRQVRFYQACSSEMYGRVIETPQTEETPFYPRSPYGVAKAAAHWTTVNYRELYGIHASNGVLFNHESPRRGETFVTRKITRAVGRIKLGLQDKLYLGNLDARRDWGFAGDFVEAMWLTLQQDVGDDYVIATGETHSVREFVELAFAHVGLDYHNYVEIDPRYCRPADANQLVGDPSKALANLGWQPKVSFVELVKMMVDADLELAARDKTLRDAGHTVDSIGNYHLTPGGHQPANSV